MYNQIIKEILTHKNGQKAKLLSGFFKTGIGQYGEGDIFLGITVPISRKIAQKYGNVELSIVSKLIKNKYHEIRLIALLILVHKYKKLSTGSNTPNLNEKKKIVDFYLVHTKYINNWDLVDLSASYILGDYLTIVRQDLTTKILSKLVRSKNIWERRIAVISTFAFIYKKDNKWTFKTVDNLMMDEHDLIHKACGWMLRETGKRVSEKELISYLDTNSHKMSRTMLRYAIERLPENKRQYFLNK